MNPIEIIAALLAIALVIFMLIKKADIKLTLFGTGLVLLYLAVASGAELVEKTPTWIQPFQIIVNAFSDLLSGSGLVILLLGGYAAYMNRIGANAATVDLLTRPLKRITSPWILVPFVFLIGNVLSIVVPSASNLAIILLATLYPVLRAAGLSVLSSAGVIATTATIMPTPLGADNVAISTELATHPEFSSLTVTSYVFGQMAPIAIPTLLVMALAHFFWQKFMDQRDLKRGYVSPENAQNESKDLPTFTNAGVRTLYALLPLLPIILLIISYSTTNILGLRFSLSVQIAVLICWLIAMLIDFAVHRDGLDFINRAGMFFTGMGTSFDIVALLVAATVFVKGISGVGVISSLQSAMENTSVAGWVLPLILVAFTALIVLVSGSGVALFYAMVPLMFGLATAAGINAFAVTVPMGMAGNLLRACSPVAAVVVIVAGATGESPLNIVKRTWFPMVVGLVTMFTLAMVRYM
ncbi:MAG: C4-dicarboxylate transporter DcuC [Arcanobacterium sp.]|nr:C4-dicarboxylate transporter DcuC [Arcanobacterium sp.]